VETPKAPEVHLLVVDVKGVARGTSDEHSVRLERPSKARDVLLKRRLRIRRRPLPPELVDQAVAGNGLARAEEEDRENAPLTCAAERQPPLAVVNLERAENAEVERARQMPNVPR
jgi:hypothetical protein